MKKILLYILATIATILSSCQDTIEELQFENDQQMAVIAIINNQGIDNKIYCYFQDNGKLSVVKDAVINIYTNDKLVETITEFQEYKIPEIIVPYDVEFSPKENLYHLEGYEIKSTFKPGDKVRLEASSKSFQAKVWSQTTVPMPATAQIVETSLVHDDIVDEGGLQDYYKVKLQIKSDNPDKPGNYRLNSGYLIEEKGTIALVESQTLNKIEDQRDTSNYSENISLEVKDDVALTDGKGFIQEEDEDSFISMDTYYFNHYRIVAGNYFKNGTYTASYYVSPFGWSYSPLWSWGYQKGEKGSWLEGKKYSILWDWDEENFGNYDEQEENIPIQIMYEKERNEYIYYEVYSLSEEEYFYLKARSNQEDISWSDSDLVEPVVLKSNINNGLGIFAIETLTQGKIKVINPYTIDDDNGMIYYK